MGAISRVSVVLSPLVVSLFYLVLGIADDRRISREAVMIAAVVTLITYPVFVVAGLSSSWAQKRGLVRNRLQLLVVGAFVGFALAVAADSPAVNFHRWRYYMAAVAAGVLWALVLGAFVTGNLTSRSSGRATRAA